MIARGECGALGETTTVSPFTVTTTATQSIDAGDTAHDTLHLTGPVPDGVTATFTAYQQDGSGRDVCTADNQIGTTRPITVPATNTDADLGTGTDNDLVRSRGAAAFTATIPGPDLTLPDGGRVHWVETLRLADGTVQHVGDCGVIGETTTVTPPPPVKAAPAAPRELAFTGSQLPILATGGAAVAAAALGLIIIGFRRRNTAADTDSGDVDTLLEE